MQVVWILVATLLSEAGTENIYSWNATFDRINDCTAFYTKNEQYLIDGAVSRKGDSEGEKIVAMMGCALVKNDPGKDPDIYQLKKLYELDIEVDKS